MTAAEQTLSTPTDLYLVLMKQVLTRYGLEEGHLPLSSWKAWDRLPAAAAVRRRLARAPLQITRRVTWDPTARAEGRDWPVGAETMIGMRRLENLERCVRDVVEQKVPGDLMETGVWRGGASIFMRAVLKALGDTTRSVWLADSFQGLPTPNAAAYPADEGDSHWRRSQLAVGVDQVKSNFAKYGLLDDQVKFLVGWFSETLPTAPVDRLAVLRLDGDLYESTIVALRSLYPKVSPGGYVIVDDWGAIPACKQAVEDFRREAEIVEPMHEIDWTGAFWQRSPRSATG